MFDRLRASAPSSEEPFWQLDQDEQFRLALDVVARLTDANLVEVVGLLVADDYTNHEADEFPHWLFNGLAAARALGFAQGQQLDAGERQRAWQAGFEHAMQRMAHGRGRRLKVAK